MVCKLYLNLKKKKEEGLHPKNHQQMGQWLLRKLKIFQCIFHNIALGVSDTVGLADTRVVCILAGTWGHSWWWSAGHPWKAIIFLQEWKRMLKCKHWSRRKEGLRMEFYGASLIVKLIRDYEFIHSCWLIGFHHQGLNVYIKTEYIGRGYFNPK